MKFINWERKDLFTWATHLSNYNTLHLQLPLSSDMTTQKDKYIYL